MFEFIVYAVFIGLGLIYVCRDSTPYPPLNEHGRPMKACFSSRNGRFMWVPTSKEVK